MADQVIVTNLLVELVQLLLNIIILMLLFIIQYVVEIHFLL